MSKQMQALIPARVRKAVSERAEVLEPFQYYSEVGEKIYSFDFSSHRGIARLYLHLDTKDQKVARVLLQDGLQDSDFENWDSLPSATWDESEEIPEDFNQLLHEMHLSTEGASRQLFEQAELDELIKRSRNAPVVIGGCGRSGTTLLLSILGAHPSILAFPEENYAFYPRPFRLGKLLDTLTENEKVSGWRRWCEKTPKNVRAFASIDAAFAGDVHLIHIVRDGRDVVTSHHPNAEERYYISSSRWVADLRAGLEQKDKTLLIRYEDLVGDTENTLIKVCEFIEEPFDSRMLSFEQHSNVTGNKAWEGITARPLHKERIERWRAPEHEQRVSELMNTPGAADLLDELGYLSDG